jgi:hypothetical protein
VWVLIVFAGVLLTLPAGWLGWALYAWLSRDSPVTFDVARLRDPAPKLLEGAHACRECHPGESAHYSRSGHALTLRPAARRSLARQLAGQTFVDPELPNVTWTYTLRDGRFAVNRLEAGRVQELPIDFAFGSGPHTTTFVTLKRSDLALPVALEHRLTYFARSGSLDVTPGQTLAIPDSAKTPLGLFHTPMETFKCFRCHTAVVSAKGQTTLDPATMVLNVSCERCHGPARAHVAAARRGAEGEDLALPFGTGRWSADDQMRLCGQCHRHPETGKPERIRRDNPEIVRFQPVGLMQSTCYRASRGALSCVTCHDPHARLSTSPSTYEAACLSCHRSPPLTTCPVSPQTGCINCHMPARDAGQTVLFHDHWIAVNH